VQLIPDAEVFAGRRRRLSERFTGAILVVPAGGPKVRANDTFYRFRPGSDFYYLTGAQEADSVLVLLPEGDGHRDILFVEPSTPRSDPAFFTDRSKGELWTGPRLGIEQMRERYGVRDAYALDQLCTVIDGARGKSAVLVLSAIDAEIDALLGASAPESAQLATHLSEMRLHKDDLELEELRKAVAATKRAFEDVVRALPAASNERHIEGAFNSRARVEGNDTGYSTVAASGPNACILHWTATNRRLERQDLVLLDAGVEMDSFYTADITRTLPVSGRFTAPQERIYELVLAAQDAALEQCRPGNHFMDPNRAAMRVLAHGLEELGILRDAQEALRDDLLFYRRYSLHNVSHMLGLDVHDCAAARAENYRYGVLEPGMVFTVEPGLYLQPDDLTVPPLYRGIGVRIEDNVAITGDGYELLSAEIPRRVSDVEAWMRALQGAVVSK